MCFKAVACLCLWLAVASCSAQTIVATQVDAKTIRITCPGRFETDITTVKGFGHTFFDLAHDPQKKRDLAPVFDGGRAAVDQDGHWRRPTGRHGQSAQGNEAPGVGPGARPRPVGGRDEPPRTRHSERRPRRSGFRADVHDLPDGPGVRRLRAAGQGRRAAAPLSADPQAQWGLGQPGQRRRGRRGALRRARRERTSLTARPPPPSPWSGPTARRTSRTC